MKSEGEEWLPVVLRCLSRARDSDFEDPGIAAACELRNHLVANGRNPAAIALIMLQMEDADPTSGSRHEIDGYA